MCCTYNYGENLGDSDSHICRLDEMRTLYYKLFLFLTFWISIAMWKSTLYKKAKKRPRTGTKSISESYAVQEADSVFRQTASLEKRSPVKTFDAAHLFPKAKLEYPVLNRSNSGLFCSLQSDWNLRYFSIPRKSNLEQWTFEEKQNCSNFLLEQILNIQPNYAFSMKCEGKQNIIFKKLLMRENLENDDIFHVDFGDMCLLTYINTCCKDDLPVPNVIHYVMYKREKLTFYEFVSFISVIRFVRPCAILIHGDNLPVGEYWNYIMTISPNIVHVKRDPPSEVFGQKMAYEEHSGDLMRIEALILYGGIYLDTDTVIVKSLEPFRKYPCTMSLQSSGYMSSAFIMAEQNAKFLQKWLDGYKNHYRDDYVYNAMIYPRKLVNENKDLIHVDFGKISRPWGQIGPIIFETNWNWATIYGIHLCIRSSTTRISMNVERVKHFNSTVGSICRHVLFGNKELCIS